MDYTECITILVLSLTFNVAFMPQSSMQNEYNGTHFIMGSVHTHCLMMQSGICEASTVFSDIVGVLVCENVLFGVRTVEKSQSDVFPRNIITANA